MSCEYKIGKLKNFIYLVENLEYKVSDYKVYITRGAVYKLYTDLTVFNETESYAGRFRFNTTVTCTLNRIIDDSLFRQKNFYIVVEDVKGMQFLVSPEFVAKYTSEFTINETISYVLTFSTQSNIPTRILETRIIPSKSSDKECKYTGLGINKLYIGLNDNWHKVEYLTAEYTKTFNGEYDSIQMVFSYPVEDNDYHYDLINFTDNRWDIKLITPDGEVVERNLFPQYTRLTSEEGGTDRFTITLRGSVQGTLAGNTGLEIQYRWVPVEGYLCASFDKYSKESKQEFLNNMWIDTGEYRRGLLIEKNSADCGYTVEDIYRWVTIPDTVCVGFDKHEQLKLQVSKDFGSTWTDTGVIRTGDLIETDSTDCGFEIAEWKEVDGEYICEEYDPSVNWVLLSDLYYCNIVTI